MTHVRVGRYTVRVHNHGFFRLDGGAMFGSVPKTIWAGVAPPDEQNRILLATRSLIVEDGDRRLIVDLGCGDKWSEKARAVFAIPKGPYQPFPGVTDVVLTHLHFDHAGGISIRTTEGVAPSYPRARHYVPRANLENARSPNVRERASYLPEDWGVLERVETILTEDGQELWPGLSVHQADGHTRGLGWIKLSDGGTTVAFPSDLIPTAAHLPLPYVMGYDMCAERSLAEREAFLRDAVEGGWIVVFEHDPQVAAARLEFDERGRARILQDVALPELGFRPGHRV